MNPGGDYDKKEILPALRNRFTEIWCEGCMTRNDLRDIIVHNLHIDSQITKEAIATAILRFTEWLDTTEVGKKLVVSIRNMLTWVNFINRCTCNAVLSKLTIAEVYYHGACLTYIDSLGSGSTSSENINKLKDFAETVIRFIKSEIEGTIKANLNMENFVVKGKAIKNASDIFGVLPFYIKKGLLVSCKNCEFTFTTPTTKLNTLKLLRALQLNKPILLEGSLGVGKTSLVSALAKASGHNLLRISLSDQMDISDLFGADLPIESGKGREFAWRDGPFLLALRAGYWILLDALNLASQSVLKGLNACFDHRGEIYIPELARTFLVKPGTRLFGCQNPLCQGGARRGLPKSFLNRFTQISVDALMEDDLIFILNLQFPQLSVDLIKNMVQFNSKLASEAGFMWGHAGLPREINLRDITRWCETTIQAAFNKFCSNKQYFNPGDSVELIYVNRMRTNEDRQKIYQIYQEIFSLEKYPLPPNQLPMHITADKLFIGDVTLDRKNCSTHENYNLLVLRNQKTALKSLMQCIKMNWMSILIGDSGCGKSNVVRLFATLTGQKLKSIAVNSAIDTTEILGGFEQDDVILLELCDFILGLPGCSDYAEDFATQEIDGGDQWETATVKEDEITVSKSEEIQCNKPLTGHVNTINVIKTDLLGDESPTMPNTSMPITASSKQAPPEAMVKSQVLAIDKFAILEASEPFGANVQHNKSESCGNTIEQTSKKCSADEMPKVSPSKWTVDEVCDFIRGLPGCSDYAEDFAIQEMDGEAIMLLQFDHLVYYMNMKLGPALKIFARIDSMRIESMSNSNPTSNN